jgi:hypothetical protein
LLLKVAIIVGLGITNCPSAGTVRDNHTLMRLPGMKLISIADCTRRFVG